MYVNIYTYIHIHTYTFIYIYTTHVPALERMPRRKLRHLLARNRLATIQAHLRSAGSYVKRESNSNFLAVKFSTQHVLHQQYERISVANFNA